MKKQNAKAVRPFHVHPAALILLAIGSLCFSVAAFMSAFPAPPAQSGGINIRDRGFYVPKTQQGGEETIVSSEPADPNETPPPEGRVAGMYTVLLTASNDGYNTDTLMLGRLDTKNGTLNFISVPRDTKVSASNRKLKKINGAYGSYGKGSTKEDIHESGIEGLETDLASLIGFYPDCYAMVDMKGFVKLVDAIDGVDFDVPVSMKKNTGDMMINLSKGMQHLDGEKALQLVRWRGSAGGGGVAHDDFGRMQMQQEFLKAVAKQTLQLKNVFKVGDFISIAQENMKTNLDASSMTWFAAELMKLDSDNINFATLPVDERSNSNSYVFVKSDEALTLINETINPFEREITAKDVEHVAD